jgi:hypothetical protein
MRFGGHLKGLVQQSVVDHNATTLKDMMANMSNNHITTLKIVADTSVKLMAGTVEVVRAMTAQQSTQRQAKSAPDGVAVFLQHPPHLWSVLYTSEFLKARGFEAHAAHFLKKDYNGEVLLGVDKDDVESMQVADSMVRKGFLRMIDRLKKDNPVK